MIDKKESQESIIPINGYVMVKFVALEEKKTAAGIIVPEGTFNNVIFKEDKIYKVEILKKSADCKDSIPVGHFALANQLSGFGVPTIEPGYIKLLHETSILMTNVDKEFSINTIVPHTGRALVEVTSKTDHTESGIYIPDGASLNTNFDASTLGGKVIAVSDDFSHGIRVGDHIRWDSYMGTQINIGSKEYRLVLTGEVVAIIASK